MTLVEWCKLNNKEYLLEEYDAQKNGKDISELTYGSGEKVWWKCKYGHSYQATINHKTSSQATGCPKCFQGRQTSFAEQAVFFYVKKYFPDAVSGYKNVFGSKFELDIFIPSINTAIEYDGAAWHSNKTLEREQRKYKLCHEHGVRLIRIREEKSQLGSDIADIEFPEKDMYKPKVLQPRIIQLLQYLLRFRTIIVIDINIDRDRNEILKMYSTFVKGSLEEKYPEIAKEWHSTKNGDLKPYMFKPRSDHKAWWKCSVCGNEYESTIGHRTYGTGCPKCGVKKVTRIKEKPVVMIDINTNKVIGRFDSISDASRKTNISAGNICTVLKGKRKHTKGFSWKYDNQK